MKIILNLIKNVEKPSDLEVKHIISHFFIIKWYICNY